MEKWAEIQEGKVANMLEGKESSRSKETISKVTPDMKKRLLVKRKAHKQALQNPQKLRK